MSKVIEEQFLRTLGRAGNLQEHLGLLRGLSMQCKVVVELGFRGGISATALLAGGPKVYSYDIKDCRPHSANLVKQMAGRFVFTQGDSRKVDIPECDMLFIDTWHTKAMLEAELSRHEGKVRKWIVMHDTTTFGKVGEDKRDRGLWYAVEEFLQASPHWKILLRLTNNNGLTILKRCSV